ncbi:hypothetical protein FHS29_001574 [Saccharothrix tamanrassetensis]|uniref:Restriction endonuclease type IV Mrr domain-containing protein n=2 Tax=Saccharothrix tamanrassetensis TaxID=1051531 RepID=A0A841CF61_9PSEU|nr:hypothetical protein [Saccharothrix tamanrassetensis]
MAAAISQDNRRRVSRGETERFTGNGRGYFSLSYSIDGVEASVSEWNEKVKSRMRGQLHAMEPVAFEQLIGNLLERMGFEDIEVTQRSKDGGIDVRGILTIGPMTRFPAAVQVKRWKRTVGATVVRDLRGAISIHERGILVTTSAFSSDAKREAEAEAKLPIGLIEGSELVDLLAQYELGFRKRSVVVLDLNEDLFSGQVEAVEPSSPSTDWFKLNTASAERRFTIYRTLGRVSAVEAVVAMLQIAREKRNFDEYVNDFQRRFSSITVRAMAERYARAIVSLGFADIVNGSLSLTGDGKEFLDGERMERNVILARQLRVRIYGVAELEQEIAQDSSLDGESLFVALKGRGLDLLTETRFRHIVEWCAGVGMIDKRSGRVR